VLDEALREVLGRFGGYAAGPGEADEHFRPEGREVCDRHRGLLDERGVPLVIERRVINETEHRVLLLERLLE
jgi:hypothetical protein